MPEGRREGLSETVRVSLFGAAGAAIGILAIISLVLPASIFEYTEPFVLPIPKIYGSTLGRSVLAGSFTGMAVLFGLAVYVASNLSSVQARRAAMLGTVVLSVVFGLGYSSGAQDLFHNVFDF